MELMCVGEIRTGRCIAESCLSGSSVAKVLLCRLCTCDSNKSHMEKPGPLEVYEGSKALSHRMSSVLVYSISIFGNSIPYCDGMAN